MNEAFWNGDFACPGCGRDTNNGQCWACMHGQTPDTPSHVKAYNDGIEKAAQRVNDATRGLDGWSDEFEQLVWLASQIRTLAKAVKP